MSHRSGINKVRPRVSFFRSEPDNVRIALLKIAKDLDVHMNCHGFFKEGEDFENLRTFKVEAEKRGINLTIKLPSGQTLRQAMDEAA